MKIVLSWLQDFINLNEYNITEITQKLTDIGLEVEGVSEIETIRGSLDGLIVGEITSFYKHPNADRLSCVSVNIGADNAVEIVCGAPNVRVGMKCIVALPGTCIHTTKGEDIIIRETKIRGVVSSGMLCAGDEVGINNEHEGIFELPKEAKIGEKVSSYFNITNDFVIDISLTPNRGYALSHVGVARDLAAFTKKKIIIPARRNAWERECTKPGIIIEDKDICKAFNGVLIKNVKITSSPEWIKNRLSLAGIKPKNNIVDITNYIMLGYGQPMHAYDLNTIEGDVHIRQAHQQENFKALNNKEYTLDGDIVVCDKDKILSLAGIIGGEGSCINDNTTDIFLESASFNNSKIRLSCQRLDIRTEASYRFERGVDPTMQEYCLHAAVDLLHQQQKDIEVIGITNSQDIIAWKEIKVSFEYINNKIGQEVDKDEIIDILQRLDFKIKSTHTDIICSVPPYRENVQYPSDVVEEILRLKGFNSINIDANKTLFTVRHNISEEFLKRGKILSKTTSYLTSIGFYEVINSPLVSSSVENKSTIKIVNPSGIYDTLRTETITSGLQTAKINIDAGNKNLKFFEIGKAYLKDGAGYKEEEHLSIFISSVEEKNWQGESEKCSYFKIKEIVLTILKLLNIDYNKEETNENKTTIKKEDLQIVQYGLISAKTLRELDIHQDIFFADINVKNLIQASGNSRKQFCTINYYPITKRELSFTINKETKYDDIIQKIKSSKIENLKEIRLIDIYNNENKLGVGKKAYSFFFGFQAEDHTLTEEEINRSTDHIIKILSATFDAQLRTE